MRRMSVGRSLGTLGALVAVFVLGGAPAWGQAAKDGVDLRPKFKSGEETRYKMQITQTAKSKGSKGSPLGDSAGGDDNTEHEIKFSLKVRSVEQDGTANVDLVYESVKVTGEMGGEKVSVDTSKPASTDKGEQAGTIRAMAGTTMSLVIDKDGNIKETKGGGGLLGGGGGEGGDLLGPIFSPGKAPGSAKPGQSWTNVDELGMGGLMGPMRLVTTHTLESASNGEARVKVKGKIEAGEKSAGGGKGSMVQITKSDHAGAYVWDTERGQIKSFNSTMKSEIKVNLGEGMDMTRTGDTVMKLERIGTESADKQKPFDKPKDKADPKTADPGHDKPQPKRK
jgi:hypothetical protein